MAGKPAGLTQSEIKTLMLAKLMGSALDEDDARAMRCTPITKIEAARYGLAYAAEAFALPYFTTGGVPKRFFRARYVVDTRQGFDKIAGKKSVKYVQPKGSDPDIYLPPLGGVDWAHLAADVSQPLLVTEGELKAACATKHGHPTIGLGGVWSFQSGANGQELLPALVAFSWVGRSVYIVYDSDAATNSKVVQAEEVLAQRLLDRDAVVHIVRLPSQEDIQKCGLDDYIVLYGAEAFTALLKDPERTYEYAGSKALHAMNQLVIYVRQQRFIWSHEDNQRMSAGEFKEHRYANRFHLQSRANAKGEVIVTRVATAKAWLEWGARAEALGVDFQPGGDRITDQGNLNTWTGWGVSEPIPGDVAPWEHLLHHLFGDEPASRKWFEQWCAWPLQNPGGKMANAVALWGPVHGSGKTLVGHTLMRIYGAKHSVELKDASLENDRNEWAEGIQFALCDDITARGDRKFMRKLMTMITQKTIMMDPKYINSYVIRDCINYYFTSNDPDALYMDTGDRRFFVHEVRGGKYLDYKAYVKWRDSSIGIAALWDYLLRLDISDFDPQAAPPTTYGKTSMTDLGKSELGAWVNEFRQNMDSVLGAAGFKGDLFTAKELHGLFDPSGVSRTTENALARELKRAGFINPATGNRLRRADGLMVAVYAVRNLGKWKSASWSDACRHYDESRQGKLAPAKPRKF